MMKKLKLAICALLAVCLIFAFSGCGEKAASPENTAATVTSTRAYGNNTAAKAMDGDIETGWVSAAIASEINIPFLQVEYEKTVEVSSITIDDSFAAGRTAEVKEYETVVPSTKPAAFDYTLSPDEDAHMATHVFSESDANGWRSNVAPSADEPQAFYAEFRTAVNADRIVLDNEPMDVVPMRFKLLVSENEVPAEHKLDPDYEGWKEVLSAEDNAEYTITKDFQEGVSAKSVLYIVYEQSEGNACLHGLYFQKKLTELDTAHYPVDFNLMYSADGSEYEIIEVRKNDSAVYTYTFAQKTKLKYIRYMPVTEYDGNKPSVGEIVVR